MPDEPNIEVTDRPDENRFAVLVDGVDAGGAYYERRGDRVVFDHTEVSDRFEGMGVGSALARSALDSVRAAGQKAVPVCPFIARYVDNHPEYADLVDHEMLAETKKG